MNMITKCYNILLNEQERLGIKRAVRLCGFRDGRCPVALKQLLEVVLKTLVCWIECGEGWEKKGSLFFLPLSQPASAPQTGEDVLLVKHF